MCSKIATSNPSIIKNQLMNHIRYEGLTASPLLVLLFLHEFPFFTLYAHVFYFSIFVWLCTPTPISWLSFLSLSFLICSNLHFIALSILLTAQCFAIQSASFCLGTWPFFKQSIKPCLVCCPATTSFHGRHTKVFPSTFCFLFLVGLLI